jgi:hypothetical protein
MRREIREDDVDASNDSSGLCRRSLYFVGVCR